MATGADVRPSKAALRHGYRSGLEQGVARQLKALKVPHKFEAEKIPFTQPAKKRTYTPDFKIKTASGKIIYVETKGIFDVADRQKHELIREQHPELDIRFVFSRPTQKIRKGSPTSYAMWCDKNGFLWARERIPQEWLNE